MSKQSILLYLKNTHRIILVGGIHLLSVGVMFIAEKLVQLTNYLDEKLPVFGMDKDQY